MTLSAVLRSACLTALGLAFSQAAYAQPTRVDLSGLAWLDYTYTLASDDPDEEGDNTFDYRRLYLTADASPHKDVRSRIRLEARGGATTEQGRPSPFVKDAWVRWQYASSGHRATLGVQPPPLFDIVESVWGYRSLDQTLIDRAGVRSSRDMGLRLDGPLTGGLRYAAMVGNGNSIRPEEDGERGKAVYGQIRYAEEGPVRAAIGANYAASVPGGVFRQSSLQTTALLGAVTETIRIGVEGYVVHYDFAETARNSVNGLGASVFGAVAVTDNTSLIARYDYLDENAERDGDHEHYVLGAISYRPVPVLAIMPNVLVTMPDGSDATVLGRITVDVRF